MSLTREERRAKAWWVDPLVRIPGTDITFYTCAKCGAAVATQGKNVAALSDHKGWHASLTS